MSSSPSPSPTSPPPPPPPPSASAPAPSAATPPPSNATAPSPPPPATATPPISSSPPPPPATATTPISSSPPNSNWIKMAWARLCEAFSCCRKGPRSPAHQHHAAPQPPPEPVKGESIGDFLNKSSQNRPVPFTPHPTAHVGGVLFPPSPGMGLGYTKIIFTYKELEMATDGFSDANLLGQGGFGYVHKGVLPNGKQVAVKQLKAGSGQGEREFQAEVEIISRVHHRYLVSLVGYCIADGKRLLVYEFVPNNTLQFHLHGEGQPTLEWPFRLKIALGSAKGLAYLHEHCHPKIIHRDIKGSNILLDFKFEAMVADFGLAKTVSETNTHVSTRVMGTFGYLAPEYASSGKLTDKSDVYSFGVVLLELITGRSPVYSSQDGSLVDWARPLLKRALDDGNFDALTDRNLGSTYNRTEMRRMIACAAASVHHSARRRPRMSQIVRILEGDVSHEDLHEGAKPGHRQCLWFSC